LPLLDAPVAGTPPGWNLHFEVIAPLIIIEGLYLWAVATMQRRSPETQRLSENSVILFTLGILVIYISVGTPLDELSDHFLLSAHMLQHMLLSIVASALLLLGLPGWLLRPLALRRSVFPFAYVLTRPFVAFALFNLTLVFVHLPAAMSLELAHEHTVHLAAHLLLITTGMLMWWPVLGSVPELPRLSYGLQLVYLFVQSFVPAVLTAFIIFTGTTLYHEYVNFPRLFGLSAIDDQRIGGLIMKLGGGAILWAAGTMIFFIWFNKEEREEPPMPPPPPVLEWEDVNDELVRMGLTNEKGT
ncbi:MAG TPA: cytochrome c oxidase assembly protein, partial [Dehalococcoidia bacterium]|nr:cytochrome c oxidase assembly protein [Dehalococcoidia bacterium]